MKWFEGEISEAVKKTIQEKKVFVVFVKDENEDSALMEKIWEDEKVSSLCSCETSVCAKIEVGSVTGKQFSNIYPILCVPSTYLISNEGLPVDIIPGVLPKDDFSLRLSTGIDKGLKEMKVLHAAEMTIDGNSLATENADVGVFQQDAEMSAAEKAKQLLERSKKLKQEKEKQTQLDKEANRIRVGKEMTLARREKTERQAAELARELSEQKAKEREARQLVRDQLKQDKIDKAARFDDAKRARFELQEKRIQEKRSLQQQSSPKTDSNMARIQFRLPDGSTLSNHFQSDAMFLTVNSFISDRVRDSYPCIRLTTVFPKREFCEEDMTKSLRDLRLVPNASIIVSPGRSQAPASPTSSPFAIFMLLSAPFFSIFNWFFSFFRTPAENVQMQDGGARTYAQTSNSASKSEVRRRTAGNINRLRLDEDDGDDENNTWNGNSTQQM